MARRVPAGLKRESSGLDLFDRVFMGQRRRHGLARDEVPDPSGPVARGGGDPPLVGTQLDVLYLIVMLPDLDRPGRLAQGGGKTEAMHLGARRIAFEPQRLNKPRQRRDGVAFLRSLVAGCNMPTNQLLQVGHGVLLRGSPAALDVQGRNRRTYSHDKKERRCHPEGASKSGFASAPAPRALRMC